MQIERITAALRPRKNWEAIDLGFNMAQKWYLPLFLLWVIQVIPLFLLLVVMPFINVLLAGIIIWLLKPLFEQMQLYYVSRALFSEYPSLREMFSNYWKISKSQLIAILTIRRFSLSRNFNNPVNLLEGLAGKKRSKRLTLLQISKRSACQWFHIFCYTFEMVLWLGFCFFLYALIPEDIEWITIDGLLMYEDGKEALISTIFYLLSMAIIAPFYVCGGFSLYLTRRTELEGWDIELNFRRISERLKKMQPSAAIIFLCLSSFIFLSTHNQTAFAIEQDESKKIIQEVLQQDEFGKLNKTKHWEPIKKNKDNDKNDWDLSWIFDSLDNFFKWIVEMMPAIAGILEFLLWVGIIILIIYVVARFSSWLEWTGISINKNKNDYVPPQKIFGLEVNEESLPDDVVAEVRQLILNRKFRDAMSLLYRASLVRLIYMHQLEIDESTTEGECNKIVKTLRPDDEASFFSELTQTWLIIAYAHEYPDPSILENLCDKWVTFYELKNARK